MKTPTRIAILAYPGCMGVEIFGVADLLLIANLLAKNMRKHPIPLLEIQVVGLRGAMVNVAGLIPIGVKRPRGVYDVLIVPGFEVSRTTHWESKLAHLQEERAYIRKSFARSTALASVCNGSFLLAEAGLLDGRRATTAWLVSKDFEKRYPLVEHVAEAVLLEDGAITTTGAVTSAFDLALHLIKRSFGADIATATARIALLQPKRTSQAPYVDSLLSDSRLPSFSESVLHWLKGRLAQPYSLDALARSFHVSSRTLLRRVKTETGLSPLSLLRQARVEKAKQLLTGTRLSIPQIVEAVGYSDVASFAGLFVKVVGETPSQYRRH
jgi:transcriptional regulator GlxA family with amidase domain